MWSYEARWVNHRAQLEADVAALSARMVDADDETRPHLADKRAGIRHALELMDAADRVTGPRA